MEENEIRRGRGFGGTGFIYPKYLSNNIKPLIKYNHDRVSVMELKCSSYNLVIINVYMPFLDRSDLQNAISKYDENHRFIDFILNDNSDAQFVILIVICIILLILFLHLSMTLLPLVT